jgi:serine/threonine protein kinase, bacterial
MSTPEVGAVPFPGYRLVRLRGKGGFATVWEADAPGGKRVALKFMAAGRDATTTSREVRSIQSVQALDHPHLFRIRNVWSLPGYIVIGMDLADASLLDLLQLYLEDLGKHIEPEKVCRYLFPIAEALDFLNTRQHRIDGRLVGFQHGDVKPNNILLIGDHPMLADYGLATPTSGPITPCPRAGTIEYCAPEVFQGTLTDRSDQYSFAVTYHVLRTGTFPFPSAPSEKAGSSRLRDYKRPEPDLSGLAPAERQAVARALSPIPQQRFLGCTEFMLALLPTLGMRAVRDDETGERRIEPIGPSGSGSKAETFI